MNERTLGSVVDDKNYLKMSAFRFTKLYTSPWCDLARPKPKPHTIEGSRVTEIDTYHLLKERYLVSNRKDDGVFVKIGNAAASEHAVACVDDSRVLYHRPFVAERLSSSTLSHRDVVCAFGRYFVPN